MCNYRQQISSKLPLYSSHPLLEGNISYRKSDLLSCLCLLLLYLRIVLTVFGLCTKHNIHFQNTTCISMIKKSSVISCKIYICVNLQEIPILGYINLNKGYCSILFLVIQPEKGRIYVQECQSSVRGHFQVLLRQFTMAGLRL